MTSPDGAWTDVVSRAQGFVAGFCLGDALASNPGGTHGVLRSSDLSRVFLNAALALDWVLLRNENLLERRAIDMPQDRDACARLADADVVLARSLPIALAVITRCPQALSQLSLVNAGWLGVLVDRCNQSNATGSDVAVARVIVRNAARRLLAETTDGFDTPESLRILGPWHAGGGETPAVTLILELDAACRSGEIGDLSDYGEPGQFIRTVAGALVLLPELDSGALTVHEISARIERPSVAALALALHGAAHGITAFPAGTLASLDVAPIAEHVVQSIVRSARLSGIGALDTKDRLANVTLHDADHRLLTARRTTEGKLLLEGQDLTRDEYEWGFAIAPVDIDAVVTALGGHPSDDVLELLESHGDGIWNCGESAWLKTHSIRHDFWSRGTPPFP